MPDRLPRRLRQWWDIANAAGHLHGIDPCLLLAIMDRESLGGEALTPCGPAGTGDGGHGRGLMQIDGRFHLEFCREVLSDGSPAWANPWRNVDYASNILRELIEHFIARPHPERPAVASYNADIRRVEEALLELTEPASEHRELAALDALTTGKNYVSDVLARRDRFRRLMSLESM